MQKIYSVDEIVDALQLTSAFKTSTEFAAPSQAVQHPWSGLKLPIGYTIGGDGVFCEKVKGDGQVVQLPVSTGPIWLSGCKVDLGSRETELEVSWAVRNRGIVMSRWLNRGQLLKRTTLLEMAELEGFPVFDGLVGETVKFLALLEQSNSLATSLITRTPGWTKDIDENWIFITGQNDQGILFHPEQAYTTYAKALVSSGDLGTWIHAMRPIAEKYPVVLFAILATLTAPLLRIIDAPNFAIDLWGRTSTGKTTLLQLLSSVWGKPSGSGGLIMSWNNTQIFSERVATFFGSGLPIFFDDSQTANDRFIEAIIYMIVNGVGKGRAKPYSLKDVLRFQVVMFATGEKPLTERSFPGAAARVIEIYGSPFPGIDPSDLHALKTIVTQNYGFLGVEFVKALGEFGDDLIKKAFLEIRDYYSGRAVTEIGHRFASYFASIHVAGLVVSRAMPEMSWIESQVDHVLETVWLQTTVNIQETDMAQKAISGIASWIESNRLHFTSTRGAIISQPIYGANKSEDGYVAIIPYHFNQALKELDIPSSAAVLAEWTKKNWLIYTPGRRHKQVKIDSRPIWCVCIALTALFPDLEKVNVVIDSVPVQPTETSSQDGSSSPQAQA